MEKYIVQQESGKDNWFDLRPFYSVNEYSNPKDAAIEHYMDAKLDNPTIKFRLIKRTIHEEIIM